MARAEWLGSGPVTLNGRHRLRRANSNGNLLAHRIGLVGHQNTRALQLRLTYLRMFLKTTDKTWKDFVRCICRGEVVLKCAGEEGWQGTAWALERICPHRFARPEVMNQIAVVQGGKVPERVIVLPEADFDALKGREGTVSVPMGT